jgi:hypothetical protein
MSVGARSPDMIPNRPMEEPRMTDPTPPATRRIEISDEAYDVLARTAESRGTDINGALRYLLQVPEVSAARVDGDEDDD